MSRQMTSPTERLGGYHTKGQKLAASSSQSRKPAMPTFFMVPARLWSGIEYQVGREESTHRKDDYNEDSKNSVF